MGAARLVNCQVCARFTQPSIFKHCRVTSFPGLLNFIKTAGETLLGATAAVPAPSQGAI
jgi:hypothetical protein